MRRRRFLALAAAALAAPAAPARAQTRWQGRAFGADCALTLSGDPRAAEAALASLPAVIEAVEAEFSLYRPSALTRLNAGGRLDPSPAFRAVVGLADAVHRLTDGAFDPSIQPLWQALARGGTATGAPIGWQHVGLGRAVTLRPGMALTFNGIAQGFGADAVKAHLAAHGFGRALIDMGEIAALGGPFHVGIADPLHGQLATRRLEGTAIATSSPHATLVNGQPHILHPRGLPPLWSSVTVEATTAALADALSTALVFLPSERIARLRHPGLIRITLIDPRGDLTTL